MQPGGKTSRPAAAGDPRQRSTVLTYPLLLMPNQTLHAIRRRCVPYRLVGDQTVVARPLDGEPMVLGGTTSLVWRRVADWTSIEELAVLLEQVAPASSLSERRDALIGLIDALDNDGLIDSRHRP